MCHSSNTAVEQTLNKSQHRKLTLFGIEPVIFRLRVWHFTKKIAILMWVYMDEEKAEEEMVPTTQTSAEGTVTAKSPEGFK